MLLKDLSHDSAKVHTTPLRCLKLFYSSIVWTLEAHALILNIFYYMKIIQCIMIMVIFLIIKGTKSKSGNKMGTVCQIKGYKQKKERQDGLGREE